MKYKIKKNRNNYELWIQVMNQYSQVFTYESRQDAEIAKTEAIEADKARMAEIPTIYEYFETKGK